MFLFIPKGLLDPVEWRKIICKNISIKIKNGKIKWMQKNRVRVGLLIENPPQIHWTI